MDSRMKKWLMWGVGIVAVLVVAMGLAAAVGYKLVKKFHDFGEYQAVFLTNGQVYFGKLDFEHKWAVLHDIYYLQKTEQLQQAVGAAPADPNLLPSNPSNQQFQLVKLGTELHGPEDEMFIDRDKILFWENLRDDSRVVQKIKESQSQ
jgi:hypothetical protein